MENTNKNRGAIMVEASIYFPLVIGVVMLMIYMGLFHMEESALGYVAGRIAMEAAREQAYPGYTTFDMNDGRAVDFSWDEAMPPEDDVKSYYEAHHQNIGSLYREFGKIAGLFGIGTGDKESSYQTKYADTAESFRLIAIGTLGKPDIKIDTGLFSSTVTVSIEHEFPVPGIIRYLGVQENQYTLTSKAVKNIVNPGEFVRNVDLAVDATEYLLKKLGLDENVKTLVDKSQAVIQKIL